MKGRLPKTCPDCRKPRTKREDSATVEKKLTSIEKVDRLEMLLKAAGKHISQHQ
jgi:hypothetical protein